MTDLSTAYENAGEVLWEQRVASSNLAAPTIHFFKLKRFSIPPAPCGCARWDADKGRYRPFEKRSAPSISFARREKEPPVERFRAKWVRYT